MNITSIGPVTKPRRDEVKNLRDKLGHENYNETLGFLLEFYKEQATSEDD